VPTQAWASCRTARRPEGCSPIPANAVAYGNTPRAIAEHADKFWGEENDNDFDIVDALRSVASQRAVPSAQIALAWLLGKPPVTAPIIGVTKTHQLDDAIAAADLTLSGEEVARLEGPYRPHELCSYS
jgi:1-deoxyxylulose-5-phosphate synthase